MYLRNICQLRPARPLTGPEKSNGFILWIFMASRMEGSTPHNDHDATSLQTRTMTRTGMVDIPFYHGLLACSAIGW